MGYTTREQQIRNLEGQLAAIDQAKVLVDVNDDDLEGFLRACRRISLSLNYKIEKLEKGGL